MNKMLQLFWMFLMMVGCMHDQHASEEAATYRVGKLDRQGKRYVTAPSGKFYHMSSKYFDEHGNITLAGIKRIQGVETSLPSVLASDQSGQPAHQSGNVRRVSFATRTSLPEPNAGVIDRKTFEGRYRGFAGSSAKGERFGKSISPQAKARIDQLRQSMAAESKHRYDEAGLYIVDEELGRVDEILADFSRVWIDKLGNRYRMTPDSFDSLGNLTPGARKDLLRVKQNRAIRHAPQAARHRLDGVDDDQRGLVVTDRDEQQLSPEMLKVSALFASDAVAAGSGKRIVSSEFVAWLDSMTDQQLAQLIPTIVTMPKPVAVLSPSALSVEKLSEIFHGTIDMAGHVTADFLDQFFRVQCDNQETLKLYVDWLNQRLMPLVKDYLMRRKDAVEKYYVDALSREKQETVSEQQSIRRDIAVVDAGKQAVYGTGSIITAATVAVPVVVHYSQVASEFPVVKKVLFGSCMVLIAVELKMMADQLYRLTQKRSDLTQRLVNVNADSDALQLIPNQMGQGSIDLFDQKFNQVARAMQKKSDDLAAEESARIDRELRAMQRAEQPLVLQNSSAAAVAVPVPVAKSSMKQRAVQGLNVVLQGLNWFTNAVSGNTSKI